MTEVARLLTAAQQAHQQAKRAAHDQKHTQCRQLRQQALNARVDAHTLDPEHTDPAWAEEQALTPTGRDTHIELMQFYAERGLVYQGQATRIPISENRPINAKSPAVETA